MPEPAHLAGVYSFGPFQLDARSRRLTRDGASIVMPDRQVEILVHLLAMGGGIVSKDALIEAAWQDVAVTDNSLEQAISMLRRTLGQTTAAPYIETVPRRGYRVAVPVTRSVSRESDDTLDAMLAPLRAFIEGRAALETLERDAVTHARDVFEQIVQTVPEYAPAHIGLANALALRLEAGRADVSTDAGAVAAALHHANEACRLDPASAEAWSVLGHVSHQSGDSGRALAALRRAIALDPDSWRHHVRLAYVGWGEERLSHARRALQLLPGLALAHWLVATVYIARRALGEAEHELVAGSTAQDRQQEGARFRGVGLHLLLGLVRLEQGDEAAALDAFAREVESADSAHIYMRQARANAWCAIAAVRVRHGDLEGAVAALDNAVRLVDGHSTAVAARAAVTDDAADWTRLKARLAATENRPGSVEAAFADATYLTLRGDPGRAAEAVYTALRAAGSGSSGWTLPVDPFLRVSAHREHWDATLNLLSARAA